ncbi:MAG: nucleoside triphosphate pyrophosphohydrolase [Acidimicrobiia bacterium]|nr:nucleoside triphosphate pyrophosphohydrolase [Acidimicrobiia bacterium]
MGARTFPDGRSTGPVALDLVIVGLGPGDYARTDERVREYVTDPDRTVLLRTIDHPAAAQLAESRQVRTCDDLYRVGEDFESVYEAIADRALALAGDGPVTYAVPGSPYVGESSVAILRTRAAAAGLEVAVIGAESFVDAVIAEVGVDPLRDGLRVMDGRDLPDPLVLDAPTIIGHVDLPVVLADVAARLDRVLPEGTPVKVLVDLRSTTQRIVETTVDSIDPELAGYRTSLFVDAEPGGLIGAVRTMRTLRRQCPWDRQQTHQSIVKNLIEEAYELAHALSVLPVEAPGGEPDFAAYADVEEELGDVLLQVLFQSTMASETGAFDIDDVAEVLRQKLVRRHPHVFGDVEVDSPDEVLANWDRIKGDEKSGRTSQLDGVPTGLSGLTRAEKLQDRAAKLGFDWDGPAPVFDKVREELAELAEAPDIESAVHELGDVLFASVNLARHLGVESEVAMRRAGDRFEARFRRMELDGPLEGLTLEEMNSRWESAKRAEIPGDKEATW